jgi:hypothetical protein
VEWTAGEALVAHSWYLHGICLEGLKYTKDVMCPARNSNQGLRNILSRALLLGKSNDRNQLHAAWAQHGAEHNHPVAQLQDAKEIGTRVLKDSRRTS